MPSAAAAAASPSAAPRPDQRHDERDALPTDFAPEHVAAEADAETESQGRTRLIVAAALVSLLVADIVAAIYYFGH